jgi:hypothetical protein
LPLAGAGDRRLEVFMAHNTLDVLRPCIEEIIREDIEKENYFDAHVVIDRLIEKYSDEYLKQYVKTGGSTEYYHSEISKEIDSFVGTLSERIQENGTPVQSRSRTIHNKLQPCAIWKRK